MAENDEKFMILKMLEEGKISSDEALKLLEALENSEGAKQEFKKTSSKSTNFQDEVNNIRSKLHEWKKGIKSTYKEKEFDKMIDDFSVKAEKVGKNVASTTVNFVDKVVDFVGSFVDTNSFNIFGNYKAVVREFDIPFVENLNFFVNGSNGNIILKKHDMSNIAVKSHIRASEADTLEFLKLNSLENNISLDIENPNNINLSISHEVFVPAKKFNKLFLVTTNGKIYAEDPSSEILHCETKNSPIELMGVKSDNINITTKNAKIQVSYVKCKTININTNCSIIDVKHVKSSSINATTENSTIQIENAQNPDKSNLLEMSLKTKNGNIKVNMNDLDNREYKISAKTTIGNINILIPDLKYTDFANESSFDKSTVAITPNYNDDNICKVFIEAETTNGYIEIVK